MQGRHETQENFVSLRRTVLIFIISLSRQFDEGSTLSNEDPFRFFVPQTPARSSLHAESARNRVQVSRLGETHVSRQQF